MPLLILVTGPAVEPVSLTEAKAHLKVTASDEDSLITDLIKAARQYLDGVTGILGRALITQTWALYLDSFPTEIKLSLPPIQSVTSVTYTDTDGNSQTLATSVYELSADKETVRLQYNQTWPSTRSHEDVVVVTYAAGYGLLGSDVPQPIRQAMFLLIGHWNENREAVLKGEISKEIEFAVDALIAPFRASFIA